MIIFGGVGAGGPDWGGVVGQEGQWQGARWDRELGPGVPDGRGGRGWQGARWQLLGVVGEEGKITGVVGQEADCREPDGTGAVG